MLTLLVPILIRFLLEPSQMKISSRFTIQLHEHALNWLMRVGPKYPQVGWAFSYAHFKLAKIISSKTGIQSFDGPGTGATSEAGNDCEKPADRKPAKNSS